MSYALLTDNEKAEAVRDYRAKTIGTQDYHRLSPIHGRLVTTDGVLFTAEVLGAFWLVDLVASHQPGILRRHGAQRFQVWQLRYTGASTSVENPDGCAWEVSAWSDTPGHPESTRLAYQSIPYSDFPREALQDRDGEAFELWAEAGCVGDREVLVLMLKEER